MSFANKNIKWTVDGFAMIGKVLADNGKRITMSTDHGIMAFNHGDGSVEVTNEKAGSFAESVIAILPEVFTMPKASGKSGQTKLQMCMALYNSAEMVAADRKTIINAFVTRLGMTPAGAATYYYTCTKR